MLCMVSTCCKFVWWLLCTHEQYVATITDICCAWLTFYLANVPIHCCPCWFYVACACLSHHGSRSTFFPVVTNVYLLCAKDFGCMWYVWMSQWYLAGSREKMLQQCHIHMMMMLLTGATLGCGIYGLNKELAGGVVESCRVDWIVSKRKCRVDWSCLKMKLLIYEFQELHGVDCSCLKLSFHGRSVFTTTTI